MGTPTPVRLRGPEKVKVEGESKKESVERRREEGRARLEGSE